MIKQFIEQLDLLIQKRFVLCNTVFQIRKPISFEVVETHRVNFVCWQIVLKFFKELLLLVDVPSDLLYVSGELRQLLLNVITRSSINARSSTNAWPVTKMWIIGRIRRVRPQAAVVSGNRIASSTIATITTDSTDSCP